MADNNYQAVTRDLMIDLSSPEMCTYCERCEKKRAGLNRFTGGKNAGSDDVLQEQYEKETEVFLPTYGGHI